jgi:hypothetical protein
VARSGLSRLFGTRPDEETVAGRLGAAVTAVAGVTAHDVSYNHQQYGGGAVSGTVDVLDSETFVVVLRAVTSTLVGQLGKDADRVTVYLAGRTSDGNSVVPGDLGFSQPPLGRELVRRFSG